jgi:hypothetical protein
MAGKDRVVVVRTRRPKQRDEPVTLLLADDTLFLR